MSVEHLLVIPALVAQVYGNFAQEVFVVEEFSKVFYLGPYPVWHFCQEFSLKANRRSKLLMVQACSRPHCPHSVPKVAELKVYLHSALFAQVAHQAHERDRGGTIDAVGAPTCSHWGLHSCKRTRLELVLLSREGFLL